jgi:penicillin-binding protein 2
VDGITICGKTGTAENYAKIMHVKIFIFIAFAPMENPKNCHYCE